MSYHNNKVEFRAASSVVGYDSIFTAGQLYGTYLVPNERST